uniref:Uncharacterized protein n=1 Tax=Otus sunia TaxID=257818 RepID=A0A8C8E9S4_9STRI
MLLFFHIRNSCHWAGKLGMSSLGSQSCAYLHQPWCPPASGARKLLWGLGSGAAHAMVKYSQSLSPEQIKIETSALQALTFTASFFTQHLTQWV